MNIKGFSYSAVAASMKYDNKLYLGLIYSDEPCVTAGVFTTNQIKAAPVLIDIESEGYFQLPNSFPFKILLTDVELEWDPVDGNFKSGLMVK